MGVDDAQDLLALRMRVAAGIPAGWLVFNGADDCEHALASRAREDPGTTGLVQFGQGLGLSMTGVTLLRAFVHRAIDFGCISRKRDPAFFVEYANAIDGRLSANITNHLIKGGAIVIHHVVAGAALDDVAYAFGAELNHLFALALLRAQIEPSEHAPDDGVARHQGDGELHGQTGANACGCHATVPDGMDANGRSK